MAPKIMRCDPCELEVKAHFSPLESLQLDSEDLHFVRLFIHCEGRIRDLEKALGVSYPTVKAKISAVKKKLSPGESPQLQESEKKKKGEPQPSESNDAMAVLTKLKEGEIDYQAALKQLKSIQSN